MYFFVRFTGIVALVFGVVCMLFGLGTAIYGFVQNEALIDLVNNYWLAGSNSRLVDVRFYTAVLGLGLFLWGMLSAGFGQLMLLFADLATHARETNVILRGLRKQE